MIDTMGLVGILFGGAISAAAPAAQAPTAIAEIAKQFDKHPLIMIGEWHRNVQQHVFLRELIRDPAFICRTDDIVIEFGNARLQDVADAYASGQDVTEAQLQSMYRETEVPFTWNSPVYRQFYETVREVNEKHTCAHPIRLVAWRSSDRLVEVKTLKDFEPFDDRDTSFAEVVEREVLGRKHHALLIAGEPHALRKCRRRMRQRGSVRANRRAAHRAQTSGRSVFRSRW